MQGRYCATPTPNTSTEIQTVTNLFVLALHTIFKNDAYVSHFCFIQEKKKILLLAVFAMFLYEEFIPIY